MGNKDSIIPKKDSDLLHKANLAERGLTLASEIDKDAALEIIDKDQNEISLTLAPGVDMVFVRVPAGSFLMGTSEEQGRKRIAEGYNVVSLCWEQPQHKVYLDEYWISKYPVTYAQYKTFVKANNRIGLSYLENDILYCSKNGIVIYSKKGKIYYSEDKEFPLEKLNHPVVMVNWYEALDFCNWMSGETGSLVRLPSEAEWEKAARGTDGQIYPWGDKRPSYAYCNFGGNIGTTTPVGKYRPVGDSPYGCADMVGNVWEWTGSLWGEDFSLPEFGYPYRSMDGRENLEAKNEKLRVLRGGSWNTHENGVRTECRFRAIPGGGCEYLGFRCACSF